MEFARDHQLRVECHRILLDLARDSHKSGCEFGGENKTSECRYSDRMDLLVGIGCSVGLIGWATILLELDYSA